MSLVIAALIALVLLWLMPMFCHVPSRRPAVSHDWHAQVSVKWLMQL